MLQTKELEDMAKTLKTLGGVLIAPLIQTNFLGFILIGEKINNTDYTDEEIKILTFLLKSAQTILSNLIFKEKALTDELMGIYNKRYLHSQLQEEIVYALNKGQSLSFIMIDIDHFKQYNDACGHPAADEILKEIGYFLRHTIRPSDEVFRYGGEEIAIILPNTGHKEAQILAERIRTDIKTNDKFLALAKKNKRELTISLGTSTIFDTEIINDLTNKEIKILVELRILTKNEGQTLGKTTIFLGKRMIKISQVATCTKILIKF
jgi:diguanylate cyclase (GGDEF)-like protein